MISDFDLYYQIGLICDKKSNISIVITLAVQRLPFTLYHSTLQFKVQQSKLDLLDVEPIPIPSIELEY